MTVYEKIKGRRRGLVSLSGLLSREPVRNALSLALNFLLGFTLSCARVLESLAPFGIAAVARAGADPGGISCLVGVCAGYLIFGGFDWGVRYVATVLMVFTVAFVFRFSPLIKKEWFMPLAATLITGITAFLNSFEFISDFPEGVRVFSEAAMVLGCSYFFAIALNSDKCVSEEEERRHIAGVLVLTAGLLIALVQVRLFGVISLGRSFAVLGVLTCAYKGGMLAGCAAGTVLGIAMDMSGSGQVFFTMTFAFAGLISGFFSRYGRFVFLLSHLLAVAASVIWTGGVYTNPEPVYEIFASAVIFALLPDKLLELVGSVVRFPLPATGESGLRRYASARARRVSMAFRELYGTVFRTLGSNVNDNDIATVFDRAAGSVCVGCRNKESCWQKNFMDTLSVMNDATPAMVQRGKLLKEDLAERFLEKCMAPGAFISAVNGELRGMMYRRQFRSRLNENRTAAYGQYKELADIIEGVARELDSAVGADPLAERRMRRFLRAMDIEAEVSVFRDSRGRLRAIIESGRLGPLLRQGNYLDILSGVLGTRLCRPPNDEEISDRRLVVLEAEPLVASVGIAGMKKKGEPVSGDRGTYFKTDQGVLCVILADGMGSGESAARESINAVRTLEAFLRAGVDPAVAMKLLNSVLLLKNGEEWGYSTVDLMCIDLFTGETCFYKYGAAPSFVKNGKIIRRVRGESVAAGLCAGDGSSPDIVRMKLKPGNVALIASDGVMVESRDAWLRELLLKDEGRDTKALARDALRAAVKQFGCEDDMTVLAVRLDERE